MHPDGYKFVIPLLLLAAACSLFSYGLAAVGVAITAAVAYFFRDPFRRPASDSSIVLSPADGYVEEITNVNCTSIANINVAHATRISIVLTIFDVHVNRSPLAGTVISLVHISGNFISAFYNHSRDVNEREICVLENVDGLRVAIVRIAGCVARRIVTTVKPNQRLLAGDKIGLIRFGSRVDLYVPSNAQIQIAKGTRTICGETVIAKFDNMVRQDASGC
jgi:phosphatidylserine decarboxylase